MKKCIIALVVLAVMVNVASAGLIYDNGYFKKHLWEYRSGGESDQYGRH